MNRINSPWGIADQVDVLHPQRKILRVCTPEHGGIAVDPSLPMPAHLAQLGERFENHIWFEEDQAWAAPATAFPSYFHPDWVIAAKEVLRHHYPEAFMAQFGVALTAATSHALARREWESATANCFVPTASWGDWAWDIPAGQVYVAGWRRSDEATAGFLVPAATYAQDGARLVLDGFPRWEPDRTLPYSKPRARAQQEVA